LKTGQGGLKLNSQKIEVDQEWSELIIEAKKIGISITDIRLFLLSSKPPVQEQKNKTCFRLIDEERTGRN
jgi:hypothetical protein